MAYESMRAWAEQLDRAGELLRIREPARTELEIAAAADQESKSPGGGKALLFEKPVGPDGREHGFPVLINGYGSARRMAMALGRESVEEIGEEVGALVKAKPPAGLAQAWDLFKRGLELRHARPVSSGSGLCQEVVHRVEEGGRGLGEIPVLKTWPKDGGPFLTLPQVITEDPETKERNVGMYRMQVLGPWEAALHWQLHKVGARHGKKYREMGKPMPVAVALGGDPANAFAATAPLPDGIDEYMFAGFVRKKSVAFVPAVSQPIRVPADADFVIEGTVDPKGDPVDEGPFGDHTGFYTPVDKYPRFRITAITHRKDAVYPATVVGKPPMEDFWLGSASVRILMPVLKMNFPELVDGAVDRVFAELGEQQAGALAEAAGVAIGPEQQDLVRVSRIGQGAHATEGAGAVVQGVGGHREGRLGEGNALATEPGVGQELMHRSVGRGGHGCK